MAFTYDLDTEVGEMRLIIPDRDAATAFFSDEELAYFLRKEGSVKRAAAHALEMQATDEAYVQKQVRLLDVSTNGPAVAKTLMERAEKLRTQADEDDAIEGGSFGIAEVNVNDFAQRRIIQNRRLRNGS